MLDLDHIKADLAKLSPGWWGAILAGIGAGATLVPEHRVLAGLVGGAAMFVLARKLSGGCCAECASGAQQSQTQAQSGVDAGALFMKTSATPMPCVGCNGGLS